MKEFCTCRAGSLPRGELCEDCPGVRAKDTDSVPETPDRWIPDKHRVSVVFEDIEQVDVSTYGDQQRPTVDGASTTAHTIGVESSSKKLIADVLRAAADAFDEGA